MGKSLAREREDRMRANIDHVSIRIRNLIDKCHRQVTERDPEDFHPKDLKEEGERVKLCVALTEVFIKLNSAGQKPTTAAGRAPSPPPESNAPDPSRPIGRPGFGAGDISAPPE